MLSEQDFDVLDAIRRYRDTAASGRYLELRKRFGLTQGDVAGVVGVGVAALGHYETGRRLPAGERALRYGRFMEELERRLASGDTEIDGAD